MSRNLPGWLRICLQSLTMLLFVQICLGLYLATTYKPSLDQAAITAAKHQDTWIRSFHYIGSQGALLLVFISIAALLGTKAYTEKPRLWFSTLILGGATYVAQLTGNLLPFHRNDVQTAVVEAGIADRVPLIGNQISSLMLQGNQFGQATLDAWFAVHRYVLTIVFLVAGTLVLTELSEKSKQKSSPLPALAIVVALGLVSLVLHAPSGSPSIPADFVSYDAQVSWYAVPMHGALTAFEKLSPGLGWVGSAVLPGLFLGFLFALPWLSKRISHSGIQFIATTFVVVFGGLAFIYGGTFAPPFGDQDAMKTVKTEPTRVPIDETLATKGKLLFKSNGCVNCHKLDESKEGVDLNSDWKKERPRDWYVKFIKNPSSVKPSSTMPSFPKLSEADLNALGEYVRKPRKVRGSR